MNKTITLQQESPGKGKNKNKIKTSPSRIIFLIFNVSLMLFLGFMFLFPYWNTMAKAFNAPQDTALGGIYFWPRKPTFHNILETLRNEKIIYGFRNTLIRVFGGTLLGLTVLYFAAYAMTRKGLRFKKIIYLFFIIPNFISGGIIPMYVVLGRLRLTNTLLVYILPHCFSFFYLIVIRTYLTTIPESLTEAARIDGAGEFRILFTIMIPLSKPIIATISLWLAVFHWNDWTTTLYYASLNWKNYTLQYNLRTILEESSRILEMIRQAEETGISIGDPSLMMTPEALKAAQLVITTLPILLVYPFVQKYFVQGVMIGSIKE